MLGTPEIIIILIVGIVVLAFFVGIPVFIYTLIKRQNKNSSLVKINISHPANSPESLSQNIHKFDQPIQKSSKIALQLQYETRYANTDDIMRCQADDNYTCFYFSDEEKILISKPLKEYSDLLKPQGFVRVHQSHLVNPKYVKSWLKEDGGTLLMNNGDKIPVSKPNREMVKAVLGK